MYKAVFAAFCAFYVGGGELPTAFLCHEVTQNLLSIFISAHTMQVCSFKGRNFFLKVS